MSQFSDAIEQFRIDMLNRELKVLGNLSSSYRVIYDKILADLQSLSSEIAAKRKRGEPVSEAWLYRQTRAASILQQLKVELGAFATAAATQIAEGQIVAVTEAQRQAQELIRLSLKPPEGVTFPESFLRFNAKATVHAAGRLSTGAPLTDLLNTIAPEGATAARKVFLGALIEGQNPKKAAKELKDELNVPISRALTIARTEILGAYRTANIETYQANDDIVKGWEWHCEFSTRTCAMCMAMSGTFHELSEPFGSHPNCRCSPLPVTKTFEELGIRGIKDTRPQIETGIDWFARQDAQTQKAILGTTKYELYKSGELKLKDLVGYKDNPTWGPQRYERSLKQLRSMNLINMDSGD